MEEKTQLHGSTGSRRVPVTKVRALQHRATQPNMCTSMQRVQREALVFLGKKTTQLTLSLCYPGFDFASRLRH